MDKPFKFRRAREIAGAFVLLSLGLLLAGIVLQGKIRGWFESKEYFEVQLPREGTQGIRAGSDVFILGNKTGTVDRIALRHKTTHEELTGYAEVPPDEIELFAVLEVRGDMAVFVSRQSKAVLKRDLGGFGSSFFEISREDAEGASDRDWGEGRRILKYSEPEDVKDQLTATVENLESKIVPALEEFTLAFQNLNDKEQAFQQALKGINETVDLIKGGDNAIGLLLSDAETKAKVSKIVDDLGRTGSSFADSAEKLDALFAGTAKGEGILGTLFKDTPPAVDFNTVLANLSAGTESLNRSLESIEDGADKFPGLVGDADETVEEITKATKLLQQAIADIQLLAEGLQNHWLVNDSVDEIKKERAKAEQAARDAEQAAQRRAQAAQAPPTQEPEPEKKKRSIFFWKR